MSAEAKTSDNDPHYKGHRDRVRQRFVASGPDSLVDYEMLELILFMAIPRRDVKPLAKNLIARFGSYTGVLNAPLESLSEVEGVSQNAAIALKSVQAAAHRLLAQEVREQPVLNSWSRLVDYCRVAMGHETREQFRILFLNKKNELIADEIQGKGTVDHTPVYVREVAKRSLDLGATAIILLHNHPSGDSEPSAADIEMTQAVIEALQPLNIVVHDHLIISSKGYTSLRNKGLMA